MDELLKFLIEKIKKHSFFSELLVLGSVVCAVFLLFQFFFKTLEPIEILRNLYYQSFVLIALCIWAFRQIYKSSIAKQFKIIIILFIFVADLYLLHLVNSFSYFQPIYIRIYFDNTVEVSMDEKDNLLELIKSPQFIVDFPYDQPELKSLGEQEFLGKNIRNLLVKEKIVTDRNIEDSIPMLITSRMLSSVEYTNLLNQTFYNLSIISTQNIDSIFSLNDTSVKKYVATSIILEALVANSLLLQTKILNNWGVDKYTGCMTDFHMTISTYIKKTKSPELCNEEAMAIEKIFGEETKREVEKIFKKISTVN